MEVTIGKRVQIGSATLALESHENAWLEFSVGDKNGVRLNVRMVSNETKMTRLFGEGEYGVIEVPVPIGGLGNASAGPIYMGNHGSQDAYLTYQCTPYGNIMQISIQIYIEK